MYYVSALLFVVIVLVAMWLVRHPLVLLTLNVVPAAWWAFGLGGMALAAALMGTVAVVVRRPVVSPPQPMPIPQRRLS